MYHARWTPNCSVLDREPLNGAQDSRYTLHCSPWAAHQQCSHWRVLSSRLAMLCHFRGNLTIKVLNGPSKSSSIRICPSSILSSCLASLSGFPCGFFVAMPAPPRRTAQPLFCLQMAFMAFEFAPIVFLTQLSTWVWLNCGFAFGCSSSELPSITLLSFIVSLYCCSLGIIIGEYWYVFYIQTKSKTYGVFLLSN